MWWLSLSGIYLSVALLTNRMYRRIGNMDPSNWILLLLNNIYISVLWYFYKYPAPPRLFYRSVAEQSFMDHENTVTTNPLLALLSAVCFSSSAWASLTGLAGNDWKWFYNSRSNVSVLLCFMLTGTSWLADFPGPWPVLWPLLSTGPYIYTSPGMPPTSRLYPIDWTGLDSTGSIVGLD